MITTPETILDETSALLNETQTDQSSKRVKLFNRACRKVVHDYKWTFRKEEYSLTTSTGVQTYDLSSLITDYDPVAGVYEVKDMLATTYESRNDGGDYYYLEPDNKTLGFTSDVDGSIKTVVYYKKYLNVSAYDSTLNIEIPETFTTLIVTFLKHLVHESKRQRYDARNAIIDYKEQLSDIKLAEASNKIPTVPKRVPSIMGFRQMRRMYTY